MVTVLPIERIAELEQLRRLSELELSKPGALTPGGFHARNKYTVAVIENCDALLEAARELAGLKSALEFCICFSGFEILNESTPGHPSFTAMIDDCTENTRDSAHEALVALAKDIGWSPTGKAGT